MKLPLSRKRIRGDLVTNLVTWFRRSNCGSCYIGTWLEIFGKFQEILCTILCTLADGRASCASLPMLPEAWREKYIDMCKPKIYKFVSSCFLPKFIKVFGLHIKFRWHVQWNFELPKLHNFHPEMLYHPIRSDSQLTAGTSFLIGSIIPTWPTYTKLPVVSELP